MEKYFTVLAWIFGIGATGFMFLRILGGMLYSEVDKVIDNLNGFEKRFPITWPLIISIICWSWIIVN